MKILIILLSLLSVPTFAADAQKKNNTNVSFDDLLIQGKYQFSDEGVVTVEQDKVLDSLLGVRKDFKDRVERSSAKR
jgi:uncharacterized membrane protein YciS (DUF1049 family)